MFYSEDVIEDVRQRNDIVDVISSYVKLQKNCMLFLCYILCSSFNRYFDKNVLYYRQ